MAVRAGYEFSYTQTCGSISSESTGNFVWASLARQIKPLMTIGISDNYALQSLTASASGTSRSSPRTKLPGRLSLVSQYRVHLLDLRRGTGLLHDLDQHDSELSLCEGGGQDVSPGACGPRPGSG